MALQPDVRERLYAYATRHLPIENSAAGSGIIPPMFTLGVADAIGLTPESSAALAAASCLYFASADIADDCADGDRRVSLGIDVNDTCRMVFLYQRAALGLDASPEVRLRIIQLFVDCGLQMADGQERDLLGTNAIEAAEPVGVAIDKSGSEVAACIAVAAVMADLDPDPYLRFGLAFGGLAQITSDYLDLFLDPHSDDWEDGKPTLPIRGGLADPRQGEFVNEMMAGDRTLADRKARGLWHLVQADAGGLLGQARARLRKSMDAAREQTACPELLSGFAAEVDEWVDQVIEALAIYRDDPAPDVASLEDEVAACRARAIAFLARDPSMEESVDRYRDGYPSGSEGRFFGRGYACAALSAEAGAGARAAALEHADGRYFTGAAESPTRPECAGLALLLGADSRALRKAAAVDDEDPGAAAIALLGLQRVGAPQVQAVHALAAAALEPGPSRLSPVARDEALVRALHLFRGQPVVDAALAAAAGRLHNRRRLSGRFGNPLETALSARALALVDRLSAPRVVTRALVDAQQSDGGYAACGFYRVLSEDGDERYASRVVTTALVLSALDTDR